jgi:hypothetical protein
MFLIFWVKFIIYLGLRVRIYLGLRIQIFLLFDFFFLNYHFGLGLESF